MSADHEVQRSQRSRTQSVLMQRHAREWWLIVAMLRTGVI